MKKYSLAHLTVLGCPPPELIYIAGRAGYDYVSLRPIALGLPNEPKYLLAEDKVMMKQTKDALAHTGLALHDVELARVVKEKTPRDYLPAMEVGAALGAKSLLSSAWVDDYNYIVDFYAELCDLAKPFGLTVDFEFVTWSAIKTLQEALRMLRDANRENCGMMIDTLHFSRSRVALEEIDDIPREWVHFVHICDGPEEVPAMDDKDALIRTGRDARLYVGEGGIDIRGIIDRLPEVPCSIELPHVARSKEFGYAEHAWRCIESARKYFEQPPC